VPLRREALDAPCRCAGTNAGGAIGREVLDCRHDGERRQDLRPPLAVLRPQLPHRFQAEVLWMTS
jgi:hypothetical protein